MRNGQEALTQSLPLALPYQRSPNIVSIQPSSERYLPRSTEAAKGEAGGGEETLRLPALGMPFLTHTVLHKHLSGPDRVLETSTQTSTEPDIDRMSELMTSDIGTKEDIL